MEFQSSVDLGGSGATLQQPEAYLATMPPRWDIPRGGRTFRPHLGSAGHLASPI